MTDAGFAAGAFTGSFAAALPAGTFAADFGAGRAARWGAFPTLFAGFAAFAGAFTATFFAGAFFTGVFFAGAFFAAAFLGGTFFTAFLAGAFFPAAFFAAGFRAAALRAGAFFPGAFFAAVFFAGAFRAACLPALFFAELRGAVRPALFRDAPPRDGLFFATLPTVFFIPDFLAFLAFEAMLTSQSLLRSTTLRQALRHLGRGCVSVGDRGTV